MKEKKNSRGTNESKIDREQTIEMLCDALTEIMDDLGANRHIRWAPNYPEVDHAVQVAQMALAAAMEA